MVDLSFQTSPDFGIRTPPRHRNMKEMVVFEDLILPGSPLKELDQKLSPFRDQIYSDLAGIRNNDAEVQALMAQIDDLYNTIEHINSNHQKTYDQLEQQIYQNRQLQQQVCHQNKELSFYKAQMQSIIKSQKVLREQQDYVLSIKLSLASLNKSFQETQVKLKREKQKCKVLAEQSLTFENQIMQFVSQIDLVNQQLADSQKQENYFKSMYEQQTQEIQNLKNENGILRRHNQELVKQTQQVSGSEMCDSGWSQKQEFQSEQGVLTDRSEDAPPAIEEFYCPIPTRTFSKLVQPGLIKARPYK